MWMKEPIFNICSRQRIELFQMGYEITTKLYTIAILEINPWSKKSMVIIWNWSGMDCDIFGGGWLFLLDPVDSCGNRCDALVQ